MDKKKQMDEEHGSLVVAVLDWEGNVIFWESHMMYLHGMPDWFDSLARSQVNNTPMRSVFENAKERLENWLYGLF